MDFSQITCRVIIIRLVQYPEKEYGFLTDHISGNNS